MSKMPAGLFQGEMFQTGYVTSDIEHAMTVLKDRFGMQKFFHIEEATLDLEDGSKMKLGIAFGWNGDLQIELIQPLDYDVALYRDALPATGFALRFHHVCYLLRSDDEWDAMLASVQASGHRCVLDFKNSSSRSRYIDTVSDLGHYIEYTQYTDLSKSNFLTAPQNKPGHVLKFLQA